MTAALRRRVGVYALCERDGSILLTLLSPLDPAAGHWTLPGGGMRFGEGPEETLAREFVEETGLQPRIGALIAARSEVLPPRGALDSLHALQFVYRVTARGRPRVVERDGSTAAAAWIPRADAPRLRLVDLARWALTR